MRSKSTERDWSERGDGDAAAAIVKNVHCICAQHCCRGCVQFLLQKVGIKTQLPKMSARELQSVTSPQQGHFCRPSLSNINTILSLTSKQNG